MVGARFVPVGALWVCTGCLLTFPPVESPPDATSAGDRDASRPTPERDAGTVERDAGIGRPSPRGPPASA